MTTQTRDYGVDLNSYNIGTIFKEILRRAARTAHIMRRHAKVSIKGIKADGHTDKVTDIDEDVQDDVVEDLQNQFKLFGIIAEESKIKGQPLIIPCTHPTLDIWVVIDPIDGTSAYVRRQSHGIGSMGAIICNDEIICVCIYDIMTRECYFYRPDSDKVWRIEDDIPERMVIDTDLCLIDQRLHLREMPHKLSYMVQSMVDEGLFDETHVDGNSIGISMAQLWKGERGGYVLSAGGETPWDSNPIIGMSLKLGFEFWMIDVQNQCFALMDPKPVRERYERDYEILVIHSSRRPELETWCTALGYGFET